MCDCCRLCSQVMQDRYSNNNGSSSGLVNILSFEVAIADWNLATAWGHNWVQCRCFSHNSRCITTIEIRYIYHNRQVITVVSSFCIIFNSYDQDYYELFFFNIWVIHLVWNFRGSHTIYLTHTLKDGILYTVNISRALSLKSSYVFWKAPMARKRWTHCDAIRPQTS